MEHTKGQWVADGDRVTVNGETIANVEEPGVMVDKEQRLANARLIASAPELLATCKNMIEYLSGLEETQRPKHSMRQMEAVIAKAEGRQ